MISKLWTQFQLLLLESKSFIHVAIYLHTWAFSIWNVYTQTKLCASLHLGLFCHKFWVGGIWKEPFVTHRALPPFPGKSNLASSFQIVVYIFCCSAFLEKLSFIIIRTISVSYAGAVDGSLRGRATERYFYKIVRPFFFILGK